MLNDIRDLRVEDMLEQEKHLLLSDHEDWIRIVDGELSDKVGGDVVDFSTKWARTMQFLLRHKVTLERGVMRSCLTLMRDGHSATGEVFRKSVDLLLSTWEYKEEFLEWHVRNSGVEYLRNLSWYDYLQLGGHSMRKMLHDAHRLNMRLTTFSCDVWFSVWPETSEQEAFRKLRKLVLIRNKKEKAGMPFLQ